MPLSEHEQRLFDQIERSLAEDPKFASAVRASDPRFHARRRLVVAAFVIVAGLALVVYGTVSSNTLLGVASIPMPLRNAAASLGASGWQTFGTRCTTQWKRPPGSTGTRTT